MEIGQQVICVEAALDLVVGAIYTVRDVDHRLRRFDPSRAPTIRLEEIILPLVPSPIGPWETGYQPRRFRPLPRTNIKIFTDMVRETDPVSA